MISDARTRAPIRDVVPAELVLLRSLTRGDAEAVRQSLSDAATDTAGFLRFAHRHQLGTYAYWRLHQLGLTGQLSSSIRAAAKAAALHQRLVNDRLALQLRELSELFERTGVNVLFLKGPLFAQRFYGTVDGRGMADIDILIRTPDVDRVETLLLANGFESALRAPVGRRLSRYFAHHFEYRRNDLPLDVHWALQRHFSFAIDYPRIWQTAARVGFDGRTYLATSDEYELVLQILGVLTDLQVGKLTLRSLVDIYQILRKVGATLEWREFFSWRARERILRPSLFVLAVALDVLECRDEFASLAALLEAKRRSFPPTRLALRAALQSRPLALGQKLLALRAYEAPLVAAAGWWLVSLPVRLAVYGVTRNPLRPLSGSSPLL
jgi:Uncharacterised nucleotidyltransferase